ncbi:MAG: hypothetical protein L0H10_14995 [Comamonas sp.]|uniref:hypothetical protein n=1 Tax=Comamonas sp. TaxID=34028 RepID=UPI002649C95B|nr:hypothetical protein [Comamonas sp.]MDN5505100.1 hypothetical protein [Comamonas sp.]MDN5538990.1 hypothetical protein [Comamonas sp.]
MNMHPETPSSDDKPDALRELYHEAVAEDRGPSAQSSAAVLDRARQRAAGVGQQPSEPMDKPAANDRFWQRHALGGLAAVGLVGWLMLQHGAWWSGPDAGSGSSSEVVAEPAQPADIDPAAQASAPAPAIASAPAVADASAARSAQLAEKSRQSRAPAKAQQAPHTQDVQASAPAPQSEAAQASSAAAPASRAPAAKALSRSTDAAQPVAPAADAPAADAMAPQNSRLSAQLPLCPLQTEEEARRQAATERADKGSGTARKSPHCRPRKPEQLPPVKSEPGQDAAEDVATPQR